MGQDLTAALRFRQPMQIRALVRYRTGGTFPLCPQCGLPLEREYQNFCDRCGQKLSWRHYARAEVIDR